MKFLSDFSFEDKKTLVRADLNTPLGDDGKVDEKEDWRLEASLPTIKYLLEQKAKIILLAHLGRPGGKIVEGLRLDPVAQQLESLLGQKVTKLNNCLGQEVKEKVNNLKKGEVVLLENLRFYSEEKKNDPDFVKQLAELGEIYVNDAFGTSHRSHASIIGLSQYLPHCAGLLLEKEIKILSETLDNPKRPLVVVIGGAKVSTKIKVIESFLEKADELILGGVLANTALKAKGLDVGKSLVEEDMIEEVKKFNLAGNKVHLLTDAVVSADVSGKLESRVVSIDKVGQKELILDIGPETAESFKKIISQAGTIIWNGPMGLFEVDKFRSGSEEIAQTIIQSSGFSLVGGGDTITLLEEMNLLNEIDHVSSGGGAMLNFLAGKKLPGIEALR